LKFVDQARIRVISGKGGNGCLSFRREAFVPKGGPDGGDGGKGGDVILYADPMMTTLLDCQYQQLYRAKNGAPGSGSNKTGKSSQNLIVKIPVGTLVYDAETGEFLHDLDTPEMSYVAARGGDGGRGNARFATPRNRTPRRVEEGHPGQEKLLRLELKLIADVGLVGLPNSGKSTLISRVSNARPEIADYPFTTKVPGLGVVRAPNGRDFVMADIPGLIKDASKGAGMGDKFLRHIERTRLLLHLVDPSPSMEPPAIERFKIIMTELESYGADLLHRQLFAVITKMDITENAEAAGKLKALIEETGIPVYCISAVTGLGVRDLILAVSEKLRKL
jgi:GTP-binding protein